MSAHSSIRRAILSCTPLEDRFVPAQFGVPFADPSHLTMSFAPDGTTTAGQSSGLFAALDAEMPRAMWQKQILRAAQAWGIYSNVNIGLTDDSGLPFGTTGPTQGDSRFGDIRIGGFPMTGDALAVAVPSDPFISGTYAGDIYFNTNTAYTPASLYAVALHEFGHSLGLPHSLDPKSVMFNHLNTNTLVSAGDVAAIRSIYGARVPDANEGAKGNAFTQQATRIGYDQVPGGFDGTTPLLAYGDITTPLDKDTFRVDGMLGYSGPMSVRLQVKGVSLLTPRLSVYDFAGRLLAQSTATAADGFLKLTLPRTVPGAKYYVRVETAPGADFVIGRYGLGVTFDNLLTATPLTLEAALRGPFEYVPRDKIPALFRDPTNFVLEDDTHLNDTVAGAVKLLTPLGFRANSQYRAAGSVNDLTEVDFYRMRSPQTLGGVLTANVQGIGPNAAVPRVEIFDRNLKPVNSTVLVNANGSYTVQAVGVKSNKDFFLRVSGSRVGNYTLNTSFGSTAAVLNPFAADKLSKTTSDHQYTLYVGQTQLFGFTLSATGSADAQVKMSIVDSLGHEVYALSAPTGDTTSGTSTLLPPGEYTVHVTPIPAATGGFSALQYSILGNGLTDPIGPIAGSTTLTPQYQNPAAPGQFLYPVGRATFDPYLWVIRLLI